MQKILLYIYLVLLFLCRHTPVNAQVRSDTIFYNPAWEICERPVASYYRLGGRLILDSIWYFTGTVKDYLINDTLLMEGHYADDGRRDGVFNFYYPNGKLYLSATFDHGKMVGDWEWYYKNGGKWATIHFPGDEQKFSFINYTDESGKTTLSNGTGSFKWYSSPYNSMGIDATFTGSFTNGKRSGKWKYFLGSSIDAADPFFKESYDDNGNLEESKTYILGHHGKVEGDMVQINFIPPRLHSTETVFYDGFFKNNGDSLADKQFIDFLISGKPSTINLRHNQFDTAMVSIMRTLDFYRHYLDYTSKDIDIQIKFKVGDSTRPENISITGTGISDREKEFLFFLMEKFRGINMPEVDGVVIEGYYTINVFDLEVKEFLPVEMRKKTNKELFITPLTKEKLLARLEANKKNIKKIFREEYYYLE